MYPEKKPNHHDITDWNIVETSVLNTIKQINKYKNGGNVRFRKRNYEILYNKGNNKITELRTIL